MQIAIVGGGPAGLYFALLAKRSHPEYNVRVIEQNPADNTYGWGVVFSDRALTYLETADPASYRDITERLQLWDDLTIVHKGQPVVVGGSTFSGIARIALLNVLQNHCRRLGVQLTFNRRVEDPSIFAGYDLLVGADGVNSVVRQTYRKHFRTHETVRPNRYVWYGTTQLFDTLSLIFRQNEDGVFVAHCYPYSKTHSTFLVECDAATWERSPLAKMGDAESRAYCQRLFAADLDGHPLLSNKSEWLQFRRVTNERWYHENVVLIGDALRTVHFSIGSGTRTALEDAIALHGALQAAGGDVVAALPAFAQQRRPASDALLEVADNSMIWYERMADKIDLDPVSFAYDYMMRGGRLDHESLREHDPDFVAAYEAIAGARRERKRAADVQESR